MKILKQGIAPDGTHIRLEDWSEDYNCYSYGSMVSAYTKKFVRYRAEAQFENNQEALAVFEKLLNGNITILDVSFTVMKSGGNRVPLKPILEKYQA